MRKPDQEAEWLRSHGLAWAILRPDRFVYACGTASNAAAGGAAWRRAGAQAAA